MTPASSRGWVPVLALLLLASSGCGVRGLNFVEDERVEITFPTDRAAVSLPVTITWQVRDFEVTGSDTARRSDAGYFGVYVNRAPQPPGRTQAWLVREDERCRRIPGCPDEEFLAQQDVHSTTETRFTIERLPAPTGDAVRRRELHEVTIVLLNGRGERIGEAAFTREFEVQR